MLLSVSSKLYTMYAHNLSRDPLITTYDEQVSMRPGRLTRNYSTCWASHKVITEICFNWSWWWDLLVSCVHRFIWLFTISSLCLSLVTDDTLPSHEPATLPLFSLRQGRRLLHENINYLIVISRLLPWLAGNNERPLLSLVSDLINICITYACICI
jgi:hypothetical protein